ncbi:hypothetical protein D3C77_563450 [compost metagenome]
MFVAAHPLNLASIGVGVECSHLAHDAEFVRLWAAIKFVVKLFCAPNPWPPLRLGQICLHSYLPRHRIALVFLRRKQRFKFLVDTGQAHVAAHLIHSQRRVLASAAASAIGCLL